MKNLFKTLTLSLVAIFTINGCGGSSLGDKIGSAIKNSIFTSNTELNIPDNSSSGVVSELNVTTEFKTITKVDMLNIDIAHERIGDLRIYLKTPAGSIVTLSNKRGGTAKSLIVSFKDSADNAISSVSEDENIIDGYFRPETPFDNINGENPNGIWKLFISDTVASKTGKLNSWSVIIKGEK